MDRATRIKDYFSDIYFRPGSVMISLRGQPAYPTMPGSSLVEGDSITAIRARIVSLGQHLLFQSGVSVDLPLRLKTSDHEKFWRSWQPTVLGRSDTCGSRMLEIRDLAIQGSRHVMVRLHFRGIATLYEVVKFDFGRNCGSTTDGSGRSTRTFGGAP
ncbi:hypothetical protein PHMEG_0007356 [Phytophthora megakarya]|uniref:Uncharacterized protein n=1 Tax=Phytophthora megakarya TaxID=4795 RepID=A0A225WNE5_9STRA|nr:hypothetical protein PHMEG_0007356 [Phytophthora megakarya]